MITYDTRTAESWNRLLETPRLLLAPLDGEDADELVVVLGDGRLYDFTGERPPELADLRRRFERWAARLAPDHRQLWLNWVVRDARDGRALGTLQATVSDEGGRLMADLGWIIAVENQGQGYASEAGRALLDHLFGAGAVAVSAHIHPGHEASARVASAIGLQPTDRWSGGERRWELTHGAPRRTGISGR